MSKKSDQVVKVLDRIKPRWSLPSPVQSLDLLEHGMLAVLLRHVDQRKAESALSKLKVAYPDWNEMRVAQAQEVAGQMLGLGRRPARGDVETLLPAARDSRAYLQEVYQKTHGLELEFLREDLTASAKLVQQMPHLGLAAGGFLLWLASEKQLPVHAAMVRVLDRLGLVSRAGLAKRARETVAQIVPEGSELRFVQVVGEIADRWCDARKPVCWECPLRVECPFGKKVAHDHKLQMERIEAQRKRDEAKRAVLEKKEAEKRRREGERLAKRVALESAKQERLRARQSASDAKKRSLDDAKQKKQAELARKKALVEKAKIDAARKAAVKAKAAARKKGGKKR